MLLSEVTLRACKRPLTVFPAESPQSPAIKNVTATDTDHIRGNPAIPDVMCVSPASIASILRDDRSAELVVEPDCHDRIGAGDRVRELAVRRQTGGGDAGAGEAAEIVIAVFEFADQVVGDRVSDTAAGHQAAPVVAERIDPQCRNRIGVDVIKLAIGTAAGEE